MAAGGGWRNSHSERRQNARSRATFLGGVESFLAGRGGRTFGALVRYSRMKRAKDKPAPKSLPRRTWDATLREQILHQREHERVGAASSGPEAGSSVATGGDGGRHRSQSQ